jgi:hypothetical protein
MFGHEPVAAGVAGPEISDGVVVQIGGRFGRDHRVRANRASWQMADARVGARRDVWQDFSKCWHLDPPCAPTGSQEPAQPTKKLYTDFFYDVATQMRLFYEIDPLSILQRSETHPQQIRA